jgi:hypothetical protein
VIVHLACMRIRGRINDSFLSHFITFINKQWKLYCVPLELPYTSRLLNK